jgi:hypothetical protein
MGRDLYISFVPAMRSRIIGLPFCYALEWFHTMIGEAFLSHWYRKAHSIDLIELRLCFSNDLVKKEMQI